MTTWNEQMIKVLEVERKDESWSSKVEGLMKIFFTAERAGIDPGLAEQAGISKLADMVHEGRRAIEMGDMERLEQLFEWASTMTVFDFRVKLRGDWRPEIEAHKIDECPIPKYNLTITQEQLNQIKSMTRPKYKFVVRDD